MRRHLIGIFSLVLLAGAVAFHFFPPTSVVTTEWQAACWRMGLMLALWWLAWPQAVRLPRWLVVAVPLLVVVLVLRPKYFLVAIPLVLALAILMPRPPAAARTPQRRQKRR
jgi:hypothetical protein